MLATALRVGEDDRERVPEGDPVGLAVGAEGLGEADEQDGGPGEGLPVAVDGVRVAAEWVLVPGGLKDA